VPVHRAYRCAQCHYAAEETQRIGDPPLSVCPTCRAPSYQVVPQLPAAVLYRGGTPSRSRSGYVNGSVKLRREKVIRERDGSETVYRTLEDAQRGEMERCPHPLVARANVRDSIMRGGLIPGTKRAAFAQALDDQVAHAPKLPTGGLL